MISRGRFSAKKQVRLVGWKRTGHHRGFPTPEERARVTELQDMLIELFVEHREALAERQEERG